MVEWAQYVDDSEVNIAAQKDIDCQDEDGVVRRLGTQWCEDVERIGVISGN